VTKKRSEKNSRKKGKRTRLRLKRRQPTTYVVYCGTLSRGWFEEGRLFGDLDLEALNIRKVKESHDGIEVPYVLIDLVSVSSLMALAEQSGCTVCLFGNDSDNPWGHKEIGLLRHG